MNLIHATDGLVMNGSDEAYYTVRLRVRSVLTAVKRLPACNWPVELHGMLSAEGQQGLGKPLLVGFIAWDSLCHFGTSRGRFFRNPTLFQLVLDQCDEPRRRVDSGAFWPF